MNPCYLYEGCFFYPQELFEIPFIQKQERLLQTILAPHVTFAYKPEVVHTDFFGQPLTIKIVGYGNDGMNEGLKVELASASPEITALFNEIAVPHITLSIGKHAKTVDTCLLEFTPVEPVEIIGFFGGYTTERDVILTP